jgi:hypothetical protein
MDEQEGIKPLSEMGILSQSDLEDYYANIGEGLADGTLTESQAADLIFGPDDF